MEWLLVPLVGTLIKLVVLLPGSLAVAWLMGELD